MRTLSLSLALLLSGCAFSYDSGRFTFGDDGLDAGIDAGRDGGVDSRIDAGDSEFDAARVDAGLVLQEGEGYCGVDGECAPGLRCSVGFGSICVRQCFNNGGDCADSVLGPYCVQAYDSRLVDFVYCDGMTCDPTEDACGSGGCVIFAEDSAGNQASGCFPDGGAQLQPIGESCDPSLLPACVPGAICEDALETGTGTCRRACWIAEPTVCGTDSCVPLFGNRRLDGRRLGVCWPPCATAADCPEFLSNPQCVGGLCTGMTEGESCSNTDTCPFTACMNTGTIPMCNAATDRCVCPCTTNDICWDDFPECEDRGAGFLHCGP
jgi:hypothetical protein